MNEILIIDGEEFKQTIVSDKYYVSKSGKVYSDISHKIIKGNISKIKGKYYRRIDIKGKHYGVHRLVFETWIRPLEKGEQVNHKNDDSLKNDADNLYSGTQKENIADCFKNKHRVGHIFYLTLFDKKENKTLTFCPASKFIEYSGHPNKSGNLNKFFSKNWFKIRYEIIEFKQVNNLKELNGVTTMADECKPVE